MRTRASNKITQAPPLLAQPPRVAGEAPAQSRPAVPLMGQRSLPATQTGITSDARLSVLGAAADHALDAAKSPISRATLDARLGVEAAAFYRSLALESAAPKLALRIKQGRATLSEIFGAAARALYGAAAESPTRYVSFKKVLDDAGQPAEVDRLLSTLAPLARRSFMQGDLSPVDVFSALAGTLASWRQSPSPISLPQLKRLLDCEGKGEEIAHALKMMAPGDRTELEGGRMSPVRFSTFVESYRQHYPDVLVVGAGMAGLAAANQLLEEGRSVMVLEGRDRLGGRTLTQSKDLGAMIDEGASYLHNPDINPLTEVIDDRGFTRFAYQGHERFLFDGEKMHPERETMPKVRETYAGLMKAVKKAAAEGRDVPISDVFPLDTPWAKMVAHGVGELTAGLNISEMSTLELAEKIEEVWGQTDGSNDEFVKEGMGTVVQSFVHGVPIRQSTKVDKIEWNDDDRLKVSAGDDTFHPKKVLLTVPPNLLASEAIAFDPPLPPSKMEALEALPMGHFKKIYLKFDPETFPEPFKHTAINVFTDEPIYFIIGVGQKAGMVFAMIGGDLSQEMELKGEEKTIDYIRGRLTKMFGEGINDKFEKGWVSKWEKDPFARGAYSCVKPGQHEKREIARQPIDDKLFFAGEAYDPLWASYLPGAYRTGSSAADAIERALDGRGAREQKKAV